MHRSLLLCRHPWPWKDGPTLALATDIHFFRRYQLLPCAGINRREMFPKRLWGLWWGGVVSMTIKTMHPEIAYGH
jgi:hypothetical protein